MLYSNNIVKYIDKYAECRNNCVQQVNYYYFFIKIGSGRLELFVCFKKNNGFKAVSGFKYQTISNRKFCCCKILKQVYIVSTPCYLYIVN